MDTKTYLAAFLGVFSILLAAVAGFNAYVDPLWFFAHANAWNRQQIGFDERQQKTNRIAFGGFPYDALLLGSSRVTYMNGHDFPGLTVFNYAVSGMRPEEYEGYLRYARQKKGSALRTVFIGIDFFATNRHYGGGAPSAAHYAETAEKPLYRLESLLSADTFRRAMDNVRARSADCDCYGRDNVKSMARYSVSEKAEIFRVGLEKFRNEVYGPSYQYDDSLPRRWQNLRRAYPETGFVLFTTPISRPLFVVLHESGHGPDLERWLREAVAEFGQVYDFMGINSVTDNLDNYQDAGHFYPEIGRLIALRLTGHDQEVPADFGVRVTAENIEAHLAALRRQVQPYLRSERR